MDARRPWGWEFLKAWGYLILNRKTFAMCSSPQNKWQKSFCESAYHTLIMVFPHLHKCLWSRGRLNVFYNRTAGTLVK